MDCKHYLLFIPLLLAIGSSACRPTEITGPPPTFTVMVKPSPTRMPLPRAITPIIAEATPPNTPVVIATYTPKPPTDTATPRPTATTTPTLAATEEPTPAPFSGVALKMDWQDTDGEPNLVPGRDEGLFIWTEGDRVHLRGITKGTRYVFQGQANGLGAIVNVATVGENVNVAVVDDVSQLGFAWTTIGGPNGIDFSFSGNRLSLTVTIQGEPKIPVFVGADKDRAGPSIELNR